LQRRSTSSGCDTGAREGLTDERKFKKPEMRHGPNSCEARDPVMEGAHEGPVARLGGGLARPLLALGTLLIAVCWSLGFTTFTIGHLNIFSIAFMPMLLGLGIDYGRYFIARFAEEAAATRAMQPALVRAFVTTGPGIAATALTTAFTFGTLLLPGFKGVAELGFIGGSRSY
jgi:predicted exporter